MAWVPMDKVRTKPNTVHFIIWIASARLIGGKARSVLRRIGKLLILRLTPRGLRWFRLETTRSCRIRRVPRHETPLSAQGGRAPKAARLRRRARHGGTRADRDPHRPARRPRASRRGPRNAPESAPQSACRTPGHEVWSLAAQG
jgi:hypothetical protein